MLGLPGDFTPPSRFVRAVAFSTSVLPSKTGEEAVLQAFHILNAALLLRSKIYGIMKRNNSNFGEFIRP